MNANLSRHGRSAFFVLFSLLTISLVFGPVGRSGADVVLTENFQYVDQDLLGLNGGVGYDGSAWTSAYYFGSTPGSFSIVSEAARATGTPYRAMHRDLTSTVAPGTTMYFSSVMNQVKNELGYEFGWGFNDPDVRLSMFNDEWRLRLGGLTQTTSGADLPHATDFRVVGRLEFDVSGVDDRLTMWVDPASESAAHVLQVTTNCNYDTLGDKFRLEQVQGCESAKQWADVRVATDFASVAATTQPAPYLEDHFAYPDGDLHGQNGGTATGGANWDSAWTDADYGVGTDRNGVVKDFAVSAEVAWMQQSGGAARTIAREFTSTVAPGTTMYFSAILEKRDGEGGYEIAYRFGDTDTAQARDLTIGILNNQYQIRLGTATATAPDKTVLPNKPELFVGRLEFNAAGTAERLSMWTNPNFETDTPDLQLTQNLGVLSLGSLVDLWYSSGADGPKWWDDLRIGTDFQAASKLRVDIGPDGQQVQSGFQPWDVGADGANGVPDIVKDFTQFGGFTARLEKDPSGGVDIRDQGAGGGLLEELSRDGVKADALRLYFDDLGYGIYELTTYHHDQNDTTGGGMYEIFLGDSATPLVSIGQTGRDIAPASATYRFLTDESGTTYFRIIGGETWLNGFELSAIAAVPEPSALLLLLLAGFCLIGRRGGRRRV